MECTTAQQHICSLSDRERLEPRGACAAVAVRSVDAFNQYNPASLAQLVPEAKVVVDTRPPVISLKQIDDTRPSHATVEWDVRDENLDLSLA